MSIPDLEPRCGSWICTAPNGQAFEFFLASNVQKAAKAGWKVETAGEYLGRLNEAIKEHGGVQPPCFQ